MDISNRYPIDGAPSFMQPTFAIPIILSTIFTFAIAPSLILKYKYGTYGKSYFGSFQPSHLKWAFLAPVVFLFNLFVIHRYTQYDSIVFSYEINMSNAALLPYLIASNLISPIIEEWFLRGVLYSMLESKIGGGTSLFIDSYYSVGVYAPIYFFQSLISIVYTWFCSGDGQVKNGGYIRRNCDPRNLQSHGWVCDELLKSPRALTN
jgi:membrane protease YdiL (CAAX protease family)